MDSMLFYSVLLFLVLLGIGLLVKPEFMWRIDHFFTVKGGEPTEFYLTVSRFIGIICLFVSIGVFIFAFAK